MRAIADDGWTTVAVGILVIVGLVLFLQNIGAIALFVLIVAGVLIALKLLDVSAGTL